jgi:alpha/beta superfamily hydrolase
MKQFLFIIAIIISLGVRSQTSYTVAQFSYDSIIDVVYGTAIDYAGNTDTLKMDIYKPSGDNNCKRPIAIVIHGGAWVAGSKEDINCVLMSRTLAKRGYVVANINWRLGTHKASSYTMYALCNTGLAHPCAYICDSAEIYRANFRGMQDAKGAIRFMKSRNTIDSSDINNVYLIGESAGGFVAMAAAFTDQSSEKHASCFAIGDAPNPDSDMTGYGCIPSNNDLTRPDLGSIDGTLHIGTYDATVKGVASIYGGLLDLSILQQANDTPDVYLYHQGSDVVVNYNYGTLLGRMSWECFAQTNLCQTFYFYPRAYGGEGIRQHFVSLGSGAPTYTADIVTNYQYMNDCFDNGHSIDNFTLRSQNIANFFAVKIAASGNDPAFNCLTSIEANDEMNRVSVYPNPATEVIIVRSNSVIRSYTLIDNTGRAVLSGIANQNSIQIQLNFLQSGNYFLEIIDEHGKAVRRIQKY